MRAQRPRRAKSRNRFDVATTYGGSRRDYSPPLIGRRARAQIVALLALAAGLFFGVRFLLGERFIIREVTVLGAGGVSAGQIQQAAGLVGQHVLLVNISPNALQEAADRVRQVPGIDKVQVSCAVHPQAGCIVVIQSAPPLAIFKTSTGSMWMDHEGRVQRVYEDITATLMLRVEDPASQPGFGSQLPRFVVRAMEELALQDDLSMTDMTYSKETGITLVTAQRNQRVRLGVAERNGVIAEKLALAQQLRTVLASKGKYPRIIDVRFLEAPFYVE